MNDDKPTCQLLMATSDYVTHENKNLPVFNPFVLHAFVPAGSNFTAVLS